MYYEITTLDDIISKYGFDPYIAIEKHINEEIIPKFECLVSCHRSNHDEEGNPAIEFYVRYNRKLDLETRKKLFFNVYGDLSDFCEKSGFSSDVLDSMDLLVGIAGEYFV